MATERTVAPMAGFFKFTRVGQKVVGVIKQYRLGAEQRPFVVLSPVGIVGNPKAGMILYQSVAIGLSTDLTLKISAQDVGRYVSIEFADTEPTKKDSKKKLFKVLDLEREELIDLVQGADDTYRNEVYSVADAAVDNEDEPQPSLSSATDDDLPF